MCNHESYYSAHKGRTLGFTPTQIDTPLSGTLFLEN
jgi:hypothetical protein